MIIMITIIHMICQRPILRYKQKNFFVALNTYTVFENHLKCLSILAFSINFWPIKTSCLVTFFDHKLQVFKLTIFGIFQQFLAYKKTYLSGNTSCFQIDYFGHFSPIFGLLKLICLVTLFDRKLHVFKLTIFGTFHQFLTF